MNKKESKKKIIISVASLIILLLIVIGISYAAFSYAKEGGKINQISLATVTMTYTEGENKITLENALPMEDEEGKQLSDQDQIFDFTVSINIIGNQAIAYEVTAEKDENSTLRNEDVRIYLEKSVSPVGGYREVKEPSGYIQMTQDDEFGSKTGEMILDQGITTKTVTYYYKLRMWISKDYEITNESRYFTIRVNVYGKSGEYLEETDVDIEVEKENTTIKKGETLKLNAKVLPENASDKRIEWTTSDENIIRVDSNGLVTGVEIGEANVIVTTANGIKKSITITVTKPNATDINVNIKDAILTPGGSEKIEVTPVPVDAELPNIKYESTNKEIADIDEEGNIIAKAPGTATIIITTETGIEKEIIVTVEKPEAEGISLDRITVNMIIGEKTTLIATVLPENSKDKSITWTSSDTNIVTVNNGEITAVAKGEAKVTVTTVNGHSATSTITVENPEAEGITIGSNTTIKVGATYKFIASVTPENARDKTVTWTSSNKSVATIDETGLVTAIGAGTTTITGATVNGHTATATVTVEKNWYYCDETDNGVPNPPELVGDMIPVVYNENTKNWEKADINGKWYDYEEQMWANAVTIKDQTKRVQYVSASAGTEIPIEDINTMMVWIPRYSYTLGNKYGCKIEGADDPKIETPGAFNIKFVDKNTIELGSGQYSGEEVNNYFTPSSFCWGDSCDNEATRKDAGNIELSGIWVSKFELTGTLSDISSLPNKTSIGNQNIATIFNSIRNNMNGVNGRNTYGFNGSYDSHMIKSTEWGAFTYLSQSKYGKYGNDNFSGANKEIYKNNYYYQYMYNKTGCSSGRPYAEYSETCQYTYNQELEGTGASTTGTIYGIYDTTGGSIQYVMGNYNGFADSYVPGTSGFNGPSRKKEEVTTTGIDFPARRYYNLYNELDIGIKGDATKETERFYNDFGLFFENNIWGVRGGSPLSSTNEVGIFSFSEGSGGGQLFLSSRITIIIL